jgi:dihydropteroate synthase
MKSMPALLVRTRPVVLGIINVTPDSFSDGGHHLSVDAAIRYGEALLGDGADWLDIGGESTRPGATPVPAEEEWRRIEGVVAHFSAHAVVSIDTRKAWVAERALGVGARLINDVSAGRDPLMLPLVARHGAGFIAMHMRGEPESMQTSLTPYEDVTREVVAFLAERVAAARAVGILDVWVDPGLGFGKSFADNWQLMKDLRHFSGLGQGIAFGCSRKRFLSELGGDRDEASALLAHSAVLAGASVIRAHDVKRTRVAVDMAQRLIA